MKLLLILPISIYILLSKQTQVKTNNVSTVCGNFAAGKLDALKTFEALDLNIDDYSIGLDNTAKIFCA